MTNYQLWIQNHLWHLMFRSLCFKINHTYFSPPSWISVVHFRLNCGISISLWLIIQSERLAAVPKHRANALKPKVARTASSQADGRFQVTPLVPESSAFPPLWGLLSHLPITIKISNPSMANYHEQKSSGQVRSVDNRRTAWRITNV